jgi:hypothetical protein
LHAKFKNVLENRPSVDNVKAERSVGAILGNTQVDELTAATSTGCTTWPKVELQQTNIHEDGRRLRPIFRQKATFRDFSAGGGISAEKGASLAWLFSYCLAASLSCFTLLGILQAFRSIR